MEKNTDPAGKKSAADYAERRRRMRETGIGFAGLDGVWWRPALEPFPLPQSMARQLAAAGRAIFALFDVLQKLYRQEEDSALNRLLQHKVPVRLRSLVSTSPVLSVRPDFQLQPMADGSYLPVATELEICPSAQGFAHAMQLGYGLNCDLLEDFRWLLSGRPLWFVGTSQWSEFLWEQLAFCHALAEVGAKAWVLYDRPLSDIVRSVKRGQRWQPPMFGVRRRPADWDTDVMGRLTSRGLARFYWPDENGWPEAMEQDDAVVFRFGYLENFMPVKLNQFRQWVRGGAALLNPINFILDNKATMAAVNLPEVQQALAASESAPLTLLERHMPRTLLLETENVELLENERADWIIKYAGFDGNNRAWGGRSLIVGAETTAGAWRSALRRMLDHPWPVVAQRVVPTGQQDIAYLDGRERVRWLRDGRIRLRAFLLRHQGEVRVSGAHVTLSNKGSQVSEGTEAVQAPVVFV